MLHIKLNWKKCRSTCKVALLTSGVGLKGQILKLCRFKYIFFFIKLSTKTGVFYDLNDTDGELQV